MTITVTEIKLKVGTDRRWAERALVALFDRQTADEKRHSATLEHNKVGFSAFDAEILSDFARFVKQHGHLTSKQLEVAFKKLPKYAGQLAKMAVENG